uniref:RNase H type-1 domain-containing protein n=1 Tax=Aegilops tauschii TaxID=37682 RepID=M8BHD2_AEGTA
MRAKVLLLLWRGWHLRDDCVHGKGKETIWQSVKFLRKYEEEVQLFFLPLSSETGKDIRPLAKAEPLQTVQQTIRWSAPSRDSVKLNSDAALLPDSGVSWAGAVARDYRGFPLVSVGKEMGILGSIEEAEARAALIGLKALAELYRGPLVLEMDCLTMVNELKKEAQSLSPCYGVLCDIKETLKVFSSFKISHAGRKGNSVAHELAMEAR